MSPDDYYCAGYARGLRTGRGRGFELGVFAGVVVTALVVVATIVARRAFG